MSNERTTEKGDLEEKIALAVRSVIDQFSNRSIPKKIILQNSEGFDIFKEVLVRELTAQKYDIQVVDSGVEGYFIDVDNYLNQKNYPRKIF